MLLEGMVEVHDDGESDIQWEYIRRELKLLLIVLRSNECSYLTIGEVTLGPSSEIGRIRSSRQPIEAGRY